MGNLLLDGVADGGSVASCVARKSDGSLEFGEHGLEHLDLADLGGSDSKEIFAVFVADVFHDGHSLGDLVLAVQQIGQVGELKPKCLLLLSPALARVFGGISLLVNVLLIVDTEEDHKVPDLGSKTSDGPVS